MILVDYRCRHCGEKQESLVTSPPPGSLSCSRCGNEARRLFTTAGLLRKGAAASERSTRCLDNPDVPGLCHVGEAGKKSLIARFRGDDDTLEREKRHQTIQFERTGPPSPEQVFAHQHSSKDSDAH